MGRRRKAFESLLVPARPVLGCPPYDSRMDWTNCKAVEREPGKVSGVWVFAGTRVPLASLFENLKDGASVDDFLEWFPGVKREQVEEVLSCEARSASSGAAA